MKKPLRIFVYYDGEQVDSPRQMGVLESVALRGKEVFSFEFSQEWLQDKKFRSFDPDLQLYGGRQFVPEEKDNFGIFLDSTPDRWGRVLMERREALLAKEEHRPCRTLFESDFLLGVYDESRMGAIRFKTSESGEFLDNDSRFSTPPWASLRSLEDASLHIEDEDNDAVEKWLRMLVAPGCSLGGARPKANVTDGSGQLWIAKFPSRKDRRDVGAWEAVCMEIARSCGINVSDWKVEKLGSSYHTFLTKRFDRTAEARRRHFTSAMTLLGRTDGRGAEGSSYLEMAEWIERNCCDVDANLRELYRRMAFNVAVSNCDDHLRNHGFLYTARGWTLSPAYDLTPDPLGSGLSLSIDENSNALDFNLVRSVAPYFGIKDGDAQSMIDCIEEKVNGWRMVAKKYGISSAECDLMAGAFNRQ